MFEDIDIKAIKKELRNFSKNYIENFNKIVPCGIENCLMANMIDYNKNLNIQEV